MARYRSTRQRSFNGRADFYHKSLGKTFVDYEHEVVLKIGDASWTRYELATKLGCCHLSAARRLGKHLEEHGIDSVQKLHLTPPEELLSLNGLGTIQVFVVMCVLDAEKFNVEKWYGFDADTVTATTLIHRAKVKAREAGPRLRKKTKASAA
jgi:hypothetical protein